MTDIDIKADTFDSDTPVNPGTHLLLRRCCWRRRRRGAGVSVQPAGPADLRMVVGRSLLDPTVEKTRTSQDDPNV